MNTNTFYYVCMYKKLLLLLLFRNVIHERGAFKNCTRLAGNIKTNINSYQKKVLHSLS